MRAPTRWRTSIWAVTLLACCVLLMAGCSDGEGDQAAPAVESESVAPLAPEPSPPAPATAPSASRPSAPVRAPALYDLVMEATRGSALPTLTTAGSRLRGIGDEEIGLDAAVDAWLGTGLAPAASVSFDDRWLVYQTVRFADPDDRSKPATPRLRLRDLWTGREVALPAGTEGAAWRDDGGLAYFRGDEPTYDASSRKRWLGHVYVRRHPGGPRAEAWTLRAERYVLFGWAGERLVAVLQHAGGATDVVVLDGPGRSRTVSEGLPVAISPDATRLLVSGFDDVGRAFTRLLDLESGRVLATAAVYGAGAGDWRGDRVVLAGDSDELTLIRVRGDRLGPVRRLRVGRALFEPRFADRGGKWVIASGDTGTTPEDAHARPVAVVCAVATARCRQAEPSERGTFERLVFSQSVGTRLSDGRYFGWLRGLAGGERASLVFDRARYLVGDAASRAAAADGEADVGDFYIRNWSSATVSLPIAASPRITRVDWMDCCREGVRSSLRDLAEAFRRPSRGRARGFSGADGRYRLTVRDGEVVSIDELYFP